MLVHRMKHKSVQSLKLIFHASTTLQFKSRGLFIGFYVPNMTYYRFIVSNLFIFDGFDSCFFLFFYAPQVFHYDHVPLMVKKRIRRLKNVL